MLALEWDDMREASLESPQRPEQRIKRRIHVAEPIAAGHDRDPRYADTGRPTQSWLQQG